jgi:anti-sigma-K factor RskA
VSDTFDHSGMPADELLAAELALGVLTGSERARAQQRRLREPAFDALVVAWERRLAPWAARIGEATPPAHVWDNIVAQLPPSPGARPRLWHSLSFWRGLALASGALAAACLAALVYLGTLTPSPPLVAAIDGGGHHHFVATIDTRRGTIAVVPAAFAADATRVPELWLVPPEGKPHSLGLLRADRTVTITIPPVLIPHTTSSAVLAVSLEPPGGSPTGQPTGPVIASGKLTTL